MDVTKDNLEEALVALESLLPTAEFVAMDEEMTGISVPGVNNLARDRPQERYLKMREVASRYRIIQFGIALFHKQEDGSFVARPFNFFLFPAVGDICLEGSAVAFNCGHNMDWNKWIYKGIPYVDGPTEARVTEATFPSGDQAETAGQPGWKAARNSQPPTLTREEDKVTFAEAMRLLDEFLAESGESAPTELVLPRGNGFMRKVYYQALEEKHPDLVCESRQVGDDRWTKDFVVLRLSDEQKVEREERQRAEKQAVLDKKLGFRRVFKLLSDAGKPLIGHNCMFDLLFMMSHFEGPLPDTFADAQEALHRRFPIVFDTKLMASNRDLTAVAPVQSAAPTTEDGGGVAAVQPPAPSPGPRNRFANTSLGCVYETLAGEPEAVSVTFADGFERYAEGKAFHEAGFDAYITGYSFAALAALPKWSDVRESHVNRVNFVRGMYRWSLEGPCPSFYDDKAVVYMSGSGVAEMSTDEVRQFAHGLCQAELSTVAESADAGSPSDANVDKEAGGDPTLPLSDVGVKWISETEALFFLPGKWAELTASVLTSGHKQDVAISLLPGTEWLHPKTDDSTAQVASEVLREPQAKRAKTTEL